MDEEYQKKIDELEEKIKKKYETKYNKIISEEKKNILESIIKVAPELEKSKDKIIDEMNKIKKEDENKEDAEDVLNMIGKIDDEYIYIDNNNCIFNSSSKLIGYKNNDEITFYDTNNDLELNLEEDEKKINNMNKVIK